MSLVLLLHKLSRVHLSVVTLDGLGHNYRGGVALLDGLRSSGDGARHVAAGQRNHYNGKESSEDESRTHADKLTLLKSVNIAKHCSLVLCRSKTGG